MIHDVLAMIGAYFVVLLFCIFIPAIGRNIILIPTLLDGAIHRLLRGMVETVRGWFTRKPTVEGEPFLVTEYPGKLSAHSHLVDEESSPVLFNARLGEWERPLCKKLDDGEYRMELRFYKVESGE